MEERSPLSPPAVSPMVKAVILKVVTLNDLELCNSRYFTLLHKIR